MTDQPTNEALHARLIIAMCGVDRALVVAQILTRLDEQAAEIARLRELLPVRMDNTQQRQPK